MTPLIVFSHLRWDFVYQRPQHLLSRLAAFRQVLFFEEPLTGARHPWLERHTTREGVLVLRPHVCGTAPGFADEHVQILRQLLHDGVRAAGVRDYLLWFYTPMALALARDLAPSGIVYDCMDDLAAFKGAPAQMLPREEALLAVADLVFTGGQSLYESKRHRHADVHCLPSSVDASHFAQRPPDHPSQAQLGRPRLGYYGVIDERLDLDLLAALADARPDWQIVMVGPLAKIDPASLPRRPNLHWLGQRDYAELPAHLVGWDVCLMPFALNASTRSISPTKTLEYLAAGRPCVSTRIQDVAASYAREVAIADTPAGFVAACARILAWTPQERAAFEAAAQAKVAGTSWDRTALRIQHLLTRFESPAAPRPSAPSGGHGAVRAAAGSA